MPRPRSADALTVVAAVAVLLARKGSNSCPAAVAVALMLPCTLGRTWMVAEMPVPEASGEVRPQRTTLPTKKKLLCDEDAPRIVTLEGSTFVTVTPWALDGPLLVTVTV